MSVIGNIAGVPLFTTTREALAWASTNGLSGYHVHNLNGQQGYMGGMNHQQASGMPLNTNAPAATNQQRQYQRQQQQQQQKLQQQQRQQRQQRQPQQQQQQQQQPPQQLQQQPPTTGASSSGGGGGY